MKQLIYQASKLSIGVVAAIFFAELATLDFSATAGVIAFLSILSTRKQSIVVGIKRISSAGIAIILSAVLFTLFGHTLWALGLFLLIFIIIGVYIHQDEGLSVSIVLVTHIYTIQIIDFSIVLNELTLLFIGILVAWILNIHVMNIINDVKQLQQETETLMKSVLLKMEKQLLNQCSVTEKQDSMEKLREAIQSGMEKAIAYNNNALFKDYSYFIHYFQMREEQYHLLLHMEQHFNQVITTQNHAKALSLLTHSLVDQFHEDYDGISALSDADWLLKQYQHTPLPTTREEFENRAVLFQYFNDLVRFIEIKKRFMKKHGTIRYLE